MIPFPDWYGGPFEYMQDACPKCKSNNVGFSGYSTTLVGWVGGPDKNPNHHEQAAECRSCGLQYIREWIPADKNAWATIRVQPDPPEPSRYGGFKTYKVVIAGYPSCCESNYWIHCGHCGGWAMNRQQGETVRYTIGEQGSANPPSIWKCNSCSYESPEMPIVLSPPPPPPKTAWERLGND